MDHQQCSRTMTSRKEVSIVQPISHQTEQITSQHHSLDVLEEKNEINNYQEKKHNLMQRLDDCFTSIEALKIAIEDADYYEMASERDHIAREKKSLLEQPSATYERLQTLQHQYYSSEERDPALLIPLESHSEHPAMLNLSLEGRERALEHLEITEQKSYDLHLADQQAWKIEKAKMEKIKINLSEQLSQCQQQISSQKNEIKDNEKNIAERFQELAILTQLVEKKTVELKVIYQQNEQLKARIFKFKKTISWRITAPLRLLGKAFKRSPTFNISQINKIRESGYFDEAWYRQKYPDYLNSTTAFEHYINIGARKGYNPGPKFDSSFYLKSHSDIAKLNIHPLLHYILHGQYEGRRAIDKSVPNS